MFHLKSTWLAAAIAVVSLPAACAGDDLATTVAGRLRDSGALSGYRVNVKAKQGTVWLEGRVSDQQQLAAAVGIAETSPGVERVVNRLAIEPQAAAPTKTAAESAQPFSLPSAAQSFAVAKNGATQPARAVGPTASPNPQPLPKVAGRPLPASTATRQAPRGVRPVSGGEPMMLPGPGGYAGGYDGSIVDGQMVPGTMRVSEGDPGMMVGGRSMPGGPMPGGPMSMGGGGGGMPPIPMRGDAPNMPNYAWPSYAAYPNYAALQYPTQYSPTAWPYIGPFYPYPQVPLGWRRVSLEWDDGWWWLDFDERHVHSHHR
jgi:hypothetical protein